MSQNWLNIHIVRQTTENDCWICCAAMIYNYLHPKAPVTYKNGVMDPMIQRYLTEHHKSTKDQGPAIELMEYLGVTDGGANDKPFPQKGEIKSQIDNGGLFLCCVGGENPKGEANLEYKGGHWVILYGYEDDGNILYFADPDKGRAFPFRVGYDEARYLRGIYYESTTYVDNLR